LQWHCWFHSSCCRKWYVPVLTFSMLRNLVFKNTSHFYCESFWCLIISVKNISHSLSLLIQTIGGISSSGIILSYHGYYIEGIMPEGHINKMIYRRQNSYAYLVWQMCIISVHALKCSFLYLCRAASALCPPGMTYISLFYVVRPNISDYAYMLICPSGMMPSI
jgi:hypothetical protein